MWDLLGEAYRRFGPRPTLLERDFNIPPWAELLGELGTVRDVMRRQPSPGMRHASA